MFEKPQQPKHFAVRVLLGFLAGIPISIACALFSIVVGLMLRLTLQWLFPVFIAVALIAVGVVALRRLGQSGFAVGMVIALSLALLLDGACAMAYWR